MDTLTEQTLATYLKVAEKNLIDGNVLRTMMAPPKSFEQRIEDAKNPQEVADIVREELATTSPMDEDVVFQWDKYTKDYAKKKTQSLKREDQLIEGSGKPFTPPVSTEDVAGL